MLEWQKRMTNFSRYFVAICVLLVGAPALAQVCNQAIERGNHPSRYQIDPSNPGEALDLVTSLVWQRCEMNRVINDQNTVDVLDDTCDEPPENQDDDTTNNTQLTFNWLQATERAELEGNGYRIPNLKELSSLLELACFNPAIDPDVFPGATQGPAWTSTPHADEGFEVWSIDFSGGNDQTQSKASFLPVRLVRDL